MTMVSWSRGSPVFFQLVVVLGRMKTIRGVVAHGHDPWVMEALFTHVGEHEIADIVGRASEFSGRLERSHGCDRSAERLAQTLAAQPGTARLSFPAFSSGTRTSPRRPFSCRHRRRRRY